MKIKNYFQLCKEGETCISTFIRKYHNTSVFFSLMFLNYGTFYDTKITELYTIYF